MLLKETEENQKKILSSKKIYNYFGFKLFWDLIQDDSKLPNNLLKTCLSSLGELFSLFPRIQKTEKEKYLNDCFENLKNGISVPQSLILSLHIFATLGKGIACKLVFRINLISFFNEKWKKLS